MTADKKELRLQAGKRRAAVHGVIDPAPALATLLELLSKTDGAVSFYWPTRTEIDPRPVMTEIVRTRTVCLPVTHGRNAPLTFRRWTPGQEMVSDGFGVSVPAADVPVTPNVLVVPMLAFDRRCHRLGYGAGHYDRTLAVLRPLGPVTAIGLAYEAQREEGFLPAESTDQPLDAIVTECGIVYPLEASPLA
jgi:5-formyltetrahydrofolate cyclo-ligase